MFIGTPCIFLKLLYMFVKISIHRHVFNIDPLKAIKGTSDLFKVTLHLQRGILWFPPVPIKHLSGINKIF